MKKYISIRVVKANSYEGALKKVEMNFFDETDNICDRIFPLDIITNIILRIKNKLFLKSKDYDILCENK